jgi:hypothetical protein
MHSDRRLFVPGTVVVGHKTIRLELLRIDSDPDLYGLSPELFDFLQLHSKCMTCRKPTTSLAAHSSCSNSPNLSSALWVSVSRERYDILSVLVQKNRRREYSRAHTLRRAAAAGSHTPAELRNLMSTQDSHCYYCYALLKLPDGEYLAHKDHFISLALAGSNSIRNLVWSCPECNSEKSDANGIEFRRRKKRTLPPDILKKVNSIQRAVGPREA